MTGIVLFGIGSPIVVDVEESLYRAKLPITAGIHNRPVPSRLSENTRVVSSDDIPASLFSVPFLVPLFVPHNRRSAAEEAKRLGLIQPFTLIDPDVTLPRRMELGAGSYINVGCTLGSAIRFGAFNFVNRGAVLGHDGQFGDFVSIGPGVVTAGNVTIGSGTLVGAGAVILPSITIGENAIIGAGAVVTRDVDAGCTVIGNPARLLRRHTSDDPERA